jgi:polyhydroxybutyrate depolymerase
MRRSMPRQVKILKIQDGKTDPDSHNIDPARIYANGFSNGGGMAFVLSCTLSDRIAAVGMVGAAQTALYKGGQSWVAPAPFPSVLTWTASWARRNRCRPDPVDSAVVADVTRREYVDCAHDADVVLYTIHGGGHQWFGGQALPEWFVGPDNRSIDATRQMWAFFREHRLLKGGS